MDPKCFRAALLTLFIYAIIMMFLIPAIADAKFVHVADVMGLAYSVDDESAVKKNDYYFFKMLVEPVSVERKAVFSKVGIQKCFYTIQHNPRSNRSYQIEVTDVFLDGTTASRSFNYEISDSQGRWLDPAKKHLKSLGKIK